MSERIQLVIPKKAFVDERRMYPDWHVAFWREMAQNACEKEVRARTLRIALAEGPRGGTRVVFEDDGTGMSEDVVRRVYFKMGASTKAHSDTSVGGYGRARILTCFGASRFVIETQDLLIRDRQEFSDDGEELGGIFTIEKVGHWHQGSRFTIDLDDTPVGVMATALKHFLGMARIDPEVWIKLPDQEEHQRYNAWPRRGRRIGELTAGFADASGYITNRTFAEVWGMKAAPEHLAGKAVVRVNGIPMYWERLPGTGMLIAELDPALARQVLVANRGAMHWEYRNALSELINRVAADTSSTFKGNDGIRSWNLNGGRGTFRMRRKGADAPAGDTAAPAAQPLLDVHRIMVDEETEQVSGGLDDVHDLGDGTGAYRGARNGYAGQDGSYEADALADEANPLDDLPTLYVREENPDREERKAMRAFMAAWKSPRNAKAKKAVMAWKAGCEAMLEGLLDAHPHVDGVDWGVGVVFGGDAYAMHHKDAEGRHILYFNPAKVPGRPHAPEKISGGVAYELDRGGLNAMLAAIKHEGSHILHSWHDEDFAAAQCMIDASFYDWDAIKRMEDGIAWVRQQFAGRRVTAQHLVEPGDDPHAVRPLEVAAMQAFPMATIAARAEPASPEDAMTPALRTIWVAAMRGAGQARRVLRGDILEQVERTLEEMAVPVLDRSPAPADETRYEAPEGTEQPDVQMA